MAYISFENVCKYYKMGPVSYTHLDVYKRQDVHYPENTLIDISGIIECDLVSTDGGYVTPDGVHLAPGCTVTLRLRTVDLTVTVTKLAPSGTAK